MDELLAAEQLLCAVEDSIPCMEQEISRIPTGTARYLFVLEARNSAVTAIADARRAMNAKRSELKKHLPELRVVARKAFTALSSYADNPTVVESLRNAIVQSDTLEHRGD